MKKFTPLFIFLTAIFSIGFYSVSKGQVLLDENFSYPAGDLITNWGWTAHSGGGTQAITVNNGGLTFTGYIDSGIGNAALVDNNGEDDNKTFTVQTSGVVYVAFMVNVTTSAAGYFFHLGGNPIGTIFRGKVFMDATNHFGVSVGSNTGTFATTTYNLGTTYLLVLKYEIVAGTTNDIVSLFIFDASAPTIEPGTPTIGPLTDATQSDINPACVAIRQFSTSQNLLLDGIRVGLTWADVIPPLATPSLSASVSTLTGFQYVVGAGPSVSQSYNLSGNNLIPASGNLTVTGATHYEVSVNNTSFFNSVTIPYSGSTLTATPVYVRLMAGLPLGTYNNEIVANSGGGATTVNVTCSGAVVKAEPTNHVTGFAATTGTPSYSTINTTWTDATGGTTPDGYLVKGATGGYASVVDPIDGTPEPDALLVKNITQGIQTAAFTGLIDNTPYYFKIYPYTNNGGYINYKTSGTVPQATATTTLSPSITYTWIGPDNGVWGTSTNWTPTRTSPAINDILIFNGGGTKTVTEVPTQTVGKISLSGNTIINLQSIVAATLSIYGVTGTDLDIPAGCALNLNAANAITINILTTATASIGGNITFSSTVATAHRLTGVDPNSITFNTGATFTAGTFFSGNAFGTGTANSVIFASGSTYVHQAGSNPFVNNPPNSITVFQTGSLYKLISSLTPSFSGKTYANFEMDASGSTVTTTGGSAVAMDNLTVTNGTLNFNMTGTPGHSIKGNISVATGGTLNFAPASAGTVVLNGTVSQSISGAGIITNSLNSTLEISNAAGVNLNTSNVTLNGALKFTNGLLTLGSNNLLLGTTGTCTGTPSASAMIVATGSGQLQKGFPAGFTGSFIYPVGDNTGTVEYSPVTVNFTSGTFGAGNYAGINLVNAKYPADPNTGSYLKRYWAISQSGITGFTCNITFQYVTADVNGTESQIYCMKVLPVPFVLYDIANTTLHQLTANGLTSFGTFTGTQPLIPSVSTTVPVINITHNSATGGGNVTSDGGSAITARGVCYSTTPNPTIAGPHTTEPGSTGVFSSDITGLTPQTTYYLKAYATNMVGTAYGAQTSFTTLCEPFIPVIDFYANKTNIMVGESINFFDQSIYCPTSWVWQFVGGEPYSSTAQNPTGIVYNYPGVYNVCLMATNNYGTGIGCKMGYITVTAPPTPTNAKIVITEIMYNPPETGVDTLEFIELYNNDTAVMNMENFYFNNGVIFTFPNVTMEPHSYLIVAKSDTSMFNTFGVNTLKWTDGSLNNGGEPVVLYDREGFMVDSVNYDDAYPWDTLADARGPSLELCDPDSDNNNPLNWRAAIEFAAINAAGDTIWATPLTGCSDPPVADFVASDTSIMQYESVIFIDSSSAGCTAWFWTFEGGTPETFSGQTPPPVFYNGMGAFDVTLKVFSIAGYNTLVKSEYIEVGPSGISGNTDPEGYRIFPNPTHGQFTLQFDGNVKAVVKILDQLGNIVFEKEVHQQKTALETQGLAPGIYFIRVTEPETGQTKSSKLIIL